jgi:DNA-binding LytR/AlgR family response regulator
VARAAAAQRATLPRREAWDEARPAVRRAPRPRTRARSHSKLTSRLIAFSVCLALLGVGRVSLSFAVVQKSLQTGDIVRVERQLAADNAQLAEQAAQLAANTSIVRTATRQLHLIPMTNVQYLTVHPSAVHGTANH